MAENTQYDGNVSRIEQDIKRLNKMGITDEYKARDLALQLDFDRADRSLPGRQRLAKYGDDRDLDMLARDEDPSVRREVARRGRDKDLDMLVLDEDADVRSIVASQGRDDDLDILVNDPDWGVRWSVAAQGRKQDLDKLADDPNEDVRQEVAGVIVTKELERMGPHSLEDYFDKMHEYEENRRTAEASKKGDKIMTTELKNPLIIDIVDDDNVKPHYDKQENKYQISTKQLWSDTGYSPKILKSGKVRFYVKDLIGLMKGRDSVILNYDKPVKNEKLNDCQNFVSTLDDISRSVYRKNVPIFSGSTNGKGNFYFLNYSKSKFPDALTADDVVPSQEEFDAVAKDVIENGEAPRGGKLPGETDEDYKRAKLEHYQAQGFLKVRDSLHSPTSGNLDHSVKNDDLSLLNDKNKKAPEPNKVWNHSTRVYEKSNHLQMATEAKRGLNEKQVGDMWSIHAHVNLDPYAMGSDLIGVHGVKRVEYGNFKFKQFPDAKIEGVVTNSDGIVIPMKNIHGDTVRPQIMTDINGLLETDIELDNGNTIDRNYFQAKHHYAQIKNPKYSNLEIVGVDKDSLKMKDTGGEFTIDNKTETINSALADRGYEVPNDVITLTNDKFDTVLKGNPSADSLRLAVKTRDGVKPFPYKDVLMDKNYDRNSLCFSDKQGEITGLTTANKDSNVYHNFDGKKYHSYVSMSDAKGQKHYFEANTNIKPELEKMGVQVPSKIEKVVLRPKNKYLWTVPSNNTLPEPKGKEDQNTLHMTTAVAGFSTGKKSANHKYDVLVVEGALKGEIVSKLAQDKDKNGNSLSSELLKHDPKNGLIVVQVPGVQQKGAIGYIDNLNKLGIKCDQIHIAMDTDAKTNKNVTKGILDAEQILSDKFPGSHVDVMTWDHAKGLDDAIVDVKNGKYSYKDMNVRFGSGKDIYPDPKKIPPKRKSLEQALGLPETNTSKAPAPEVDDDLQGLVPPPDPDEPDLLF